MVESNVRLEGHDPLWIFSSTIFDLSRNEGALGSTLFVLLHSNPSFFVGLKIVHDGARVERINSFLGGKDLGLMPINQLEQLRKCIFHIYIEIERIQFEQVSNSKLVGIDQTFFDSKCIMRESTVHRILC